MHTLEASAQARPLSLWQVGCRSVKLTAEFFPDHDTSTARSELLLAHDFTGFIFDVLTMEPGLPETYYDAQVDQLEDLAVLHALNSVTRTRQELTTGRITRG